LQLIAIDGNRPLTAESDGNTTSYLYGLSVIAEETNEWNYALPDGGKTPRQLTDMQGEVTLSIRYTSWGALLKPTVRAISPSGISAEFWMLPRT
jgi:hypothetical protein